MKVKLIASLVGVILGVILVISGLGTTIPERILPSFVGRFTEQAQIGEGTPEYVGGDAYNFVIEASIRGGEIAGATIARAVYLSIGVLTTSVGMISLAGSLEKKEGTLLEAPSQHLNEEILSHCDRS